MSGQQPQPPLRMTDPFTSHCREWITGTPYVTQFLMTLLVASYILSWIIPVESLIENSPLSTVFCFEMYRLVVSPLVAGNLVNLILVASSFRSMGTRIESSLGSASYVCIIVIVTLTTNIVFATSCILLYYAAAPTALSYGSSGFWVVLFGLTSMECTQVSLIAMDKFRSFYVIIYSRNAYNTSNSHQLIFMRYSTTILDL